MEYLSSSFACTPGGKNRENLIGNFLIPELENIVNGYMNCCEVEYYCFMLEILPHAVKHEQKPLFPFFLSSKQMNTIALKLKLNEQIPLYVKTHDYSLQKPYQEITALFIENYGLELYHEYGCCHCTMGYQSDDNVSKFVVKGVKNKIIGNQFNWIKYGDYRLKKICHDCFWKTPFIPKT